MTFKKVRFLTPEEPYLGDITSTCSTYSSNASKDSLVVLGHASDKGLINWLGSYVPLELWTPPALSRKPRMKGVVGLEKYPKFKKYNLTQEFPTDHEKMNDLFTQKDQVYDLCFNGHFNEIGSMLAEGNVPPIWRQHPEQGMTIPMTADGTILVWPSQQKIPMTVGGIVLWMIKASHDHVGHWKMLMTVVGIILWMIKPSCNRASNNWPVIGHVDGSVEDPYDCGWDNPMNVMEASSNVTEEYVGIVASKDGGSAGDDPYDCGWAALEVGRQTATGSNTVNEFASSEHWPSLLEDNETNVFQHAEHSMSLTIFITMQTALQQLLGMSSTPY
ncbi:hypothetical protein BDR06DRAFT_968988 [Suillus hirtellus]|nr:hypothetical protein BDR06DRAFT_968988 [Suillus hirtellus]